MVLKQGGPSPQRTAAVTRREDTKRQDPLEGRRDVKTDAVGNTPQAGRQCGKHHVTMQTKEERRRKMQTHTGKTPQEVADP